MRNNTLFIVCIFLFVVGVANATDFKKISNSGPLKYSLMEKKGVGDMSDPGVFLHLGLIIPFKNFGLPSDVDNTSSERFSVGPNFEVGNMFRLVDKNEIAVGLRVSWLSVSYTSLTVSGTVLAQYLMGSVLKVGPYFTYVLSSEMAADLFYQAAPTYIYDLKGSPTYNSSSQTTSTTHSSYLGATHTIGADFRYQKALAGISVDFGSLKYLNSDDNSIANADFKIRTSIFRFFIGFKF